MIHVIVKYGSGDHKASVISDALIVDEASALIRAKQELAANTYIVMSRTLALPHDPSGELGGDLTNEFVYQPLDIYGIHLVTNRTITLTPTSAIDSVDIEQYREMAR